jgi:leucyl aminopeptidase (aminopeptidase T)
MKTKNPLQEQAIQGIFTTNLKVKRYERVLVFTDDKDSSIQKIARLVAREAKKHSDHICYARFRATENHGVEPPESLWSTAFGINTVRELKSKKLLSRILSKRADTGQINEAGRIIKKWRKESVHTVIALSYHSTSHTRFRTFLTDICRARYASMPLFDLPMLSGAMAVDWKRMRERTLKIAGRVNQSEQIEIETPNGTHIVLSKKGRKAVADTGIITSPGMFSNLPAGEVFLAPLEGTTYGRLVLEWAPTRRLKKPLALSIQNGRVVRVAGQGQYVRSLREKLREREENRNIAELGIGTNDRASRPDNILESEKIMGTIHIALGDNSTFGGRVSTPFHQDFVFFQPTLTLIHKNMSRKILIQNGQLL